MYYWTDARQHGIFLFYIIKNQNIRKKCLFISNFATLTDTKTALTWSYVYTKWSECDWLLWIAKNCDWFKFKIQKIQKNLNRALPSSMRLSENNLGYYIILGRTRVLCNHPQVSLTEPRAFACHSCSFFCVSALIWPLMTDDLHATSVVIVNASSFREKQNMSTVVFFLHYVSCTVHFLYYLSNISSAHFRWQTRLNNRHGTPSVFHTEISALSFSSSLL